MKLQKLLEGIPILEATADLNLEIKDVVYDTRKKIVPGSLFVAIAGFSFDGNSYIPTALAHGARAVVTAKKPESDIPYILVESDRLALAMIGTNWFGRPAESMTMIGVTGTNGKTSVTLLLKQVLEKTLGARVGLIGTTENRIGDIPVSTERTTPESFELQHLFAQMRDAGCQYCVMEVSSHAIALNRVGGIRFRVAAFTNLTEDHLDFHKTMECYCDTKAELFSRCDKAVLNRDDRWFSRIAAGATCQMLTTSTGKTGDLRGENLELLPNGVRFTAVSGEERVPAFLGVPGKFSVYNALTVLGIAMQLGIPLECATRALETAEGVKGRVEVVPTPGMPYTVLIDYAHTPDGLENVLSSVRGFCKGKLIVVFGCGGNRDPMKRPIMGEIGVRIADLAIITTDNPRNEEPMAIIREILSGITPELGAFEVVENRRTAIRRAMDVAEKDDIIVLAGKGHETYQEIQGVKHHLDEREEVAQYLKETRKSQWEE